RRILHQAFGSRHVKRQLDALLQGDLLAQEAVRLNPHLRLAYGYQAWVAGRLDLGPASTDVFKYLGEILEDVFGMVQEHHQAEQILEAIINRPQGMGDFAVEKRTRNPRLKRGYQAMHDVIMRLKPFMDAAISTADGRMWDTGNPFLQLLASTFHPRVGESEGVPEGYFEARK